MIKHVVMDMDGVLYRGDTPLPGAIETLNALRNHGVKVAYLTNNASRHRDELVEKMVRLGVPAASIRCGGRLTSRRVIWPRKPPGRGYTW